MVFFRIHIEGQRNIPEEGPFLLISNHQSYLDPVFCGAPLRRQLVYVARDSLFRSWMFRNICASVGAIPIRRGRADLPAIRQMLAKLNEGFGLCMFPEATRTSDGRVAPLQPGFGLLCRKAKAPIVPVIIEGAFECWPRHQKLFAPGKHITISYGRLIDASDAAKMTDKELANCVTDILRQMLNRCRISRGEEPYAYEEIAADE